MHTHTQNYLIRGKPNHKNIPIFMLMEIILTTLKYILYTSRFSLIMLNSASFQSCLIMVVNLSSGRGEVVNILVLVRFHFI